MGELEEIFKNKDTSGKQVDMQPFGKDHWSSSEVSARGALHYVNVSRGLSRRSEHEKKLR
jgi:hypothetical protein